MRVSKNQDIKQELEKTKQELSSEIKRETKTKASHPILTCLLIVILLIVLVAGWFGSLLAKTGLVEIPVLTALFYSVPEPTRIVVVDGTFEDFIAAKITAMIEERVQSVGGADIDRSLDLSFTEKELTALSRTLLSEQGKYFIVERTQIVALPSGQLELFLPLSNNESSSAITWQVIPTIDQDGQLSLTMLSLRLGVLEFPSWLVGLLGQRPLNWFVWQINQEAAPYAAWQSLTIGDGKLELQGTISAQILEL